MALAAIVVAGFAVAFSVFSFWWQSARRAKLVVPVPFAFVIWGGTEVLLLRFPLVIFNRGATATVVRHLQLRFPQENGQVLPLGWFRTYHSLHDASDQKQSHPSQFANARR